MSYIKYIESYTVGIKNNGAAGSPFYSPYKFYINNVNNNIYILHGYKHKIQCFDMQGNFKYEFSCDNATDIVCDNSGYIYLSYRLDNKIRKYTVNGDLVFEFGSFGSEDGKFNSPGSLAIDSNNNLYIVDIDNFRVQKFNSDGVFISKFLVSAVYGIAINSKENVYLADGTSRIYIYDNNGNFLRYIGSTVGTEDGKLDYPRYIAIDKSDKIYISMALSERISVFNEYDKFLYNFTRNNPIEKYRLNILEEDIFWNIVVDNNYNIYLATLGNYNTIYTINYNIEQDVTPYISHLSKLIPYGKCWESKFYTNNVLYNFIKSIAYSIMNLDNTVMGLLKSINIKESNDFLEEWEKLLGLPKPDFDIASTIEQRKLNVLALIRASKAYSIQDWKDIATIMGVDITIEQYSESSGRAFPFTFPITFPYPANQIPYLVIITFKNIDMAYINRSFPYTFPITFYDNEKCKYLEKIYNMIKPVFIKLIFKYQ
jgi:uncharacterized protein YmfQ (DUF2313 family)/DNA-binding beta-propeller fold protein YncE